MTANYAGLTKALQNTVELYTPDVLYPRQCKIVNINPNSIDVLTVIGGDVTLYDLDYIGYPIVGNEALLVPLNNNFNTSIVICKNIENINNESVNIDAVSEKQLKDIANKFDKNVTEIENNLNEYLELLENYKKDMEELKKYFEETMLSIKEELLDEIGEKADEIHTHTFKEVYTDVKEIDYINIEDY